MDRHEKTGFGRDLFPDAAEHVEALVSRRLTPMPKRSGFDLMLERRATTKTPATLAALIARSGCRRPALQLL